MNNFLEVEFKYLSVLNYSFQQNRVQPVRFFSIKNLTENDLSGITVTLKSDPDFFQSSPYKIENIPAGEIIRADNFQLNLSNSFFANQTEKNSGNLILEIYSDEKQIFQKLYPIDILAFDQWSGSGILPETLASFITPNHPSLIPVIKRASQILEEQTKNPSFDEYQSKNPNRILEQMSALFNALAQEDITYITVPATFDTGQRIRLCDVALAQKMGTCLDTTLLYASLLEAVGIHSLIVIIRGHAFIGAWLTEDTLQDAVTDDIAALTKRVSDGINEITVLETTCLTKGNTQNFNKAIVAAKNHLLKTDDFIFAIDVKRARAAGIRPLPQRVYDGSQWKIQDYEKTSETPLYNKPQTVKPYDLSSINTDVKVTKQLFWERKLLDLSLRNNLLNLRITKNTIQIISADLDKLEDGLFEGEELKILSRPYDWDNPLYDSSLNKIEDTSAPILEFIKTEIAQKRLHTYLQEGELKKSILHLYRQSKLSLEENGANTLYLALGFLKWFESDVSERPRFAPLLLIPVEMIRKSHQIGYVIRTREEETVMNITLLEMLRQTFGIVIAGLEPLPKDDSGIDVKLVFSIIRNHIKDQKRWDVEEQAVLGIFSFNKFVMWNDIHSNSDQLKENKIVSSLIDGKLKWNVDEMSADARELEKKLSPKDLVLPISADSSQLEAVYEALSGKSYILHGPPGTGKSQTITNIIANALYKGQRVLFVAEKMAALSVVQKRLAAIGLDPFCLEIHSNKARKSYVLDQLKKASETAKYKSPEEFDREAEKVAKLKEELDLYGSALHKTYPFGISLYTAMTNYLSLHSDGEIEFPKKLLEATTPEISAKRDELAESIIQTANAIGHPYKHPLDGINITSYSSEIAQDIRDTIACVTETFKNTGEKSRVLSEKLFSFENDDVTNAEILSKFAEILISVPEMTNKLFQSGKTQIYEYSKIADCGLKCDEIREELSSFSDGILSIEAESLLNEWNKVSKQWFLPKFFGKNKIKSKINQFSHSAKVKDSEVPPMLGNVIAFQKNDKEISFYVNSLGDMFGTYGIDKDWPKIKQILRDANEILLLFSNYFKDVQDEAKAKQWFSKLLESGISHLQKDPILKDYVELFKDFAEQKNSLQLKLGVNDGILFENSKIASAISKLELWTANIKELKNWYHWLTIFEKAEQLNISFLAEDFKNKNIPSDELINRYNKGFYHACSDFILSKETSLDLFNGKIFSNSIRKYKEIIDSFELLTRKEIYAKLSSNIPVFTQEASKNSEVGILAKNIKSNGRGTSVRKLFDSIKTLLNRLCPCMLMSPITVAQYIDLSYDKFDLVIFDEASQVPTSEAVGAIARGNNVVITGDPKQMPPTSFFSVTASNEEEPEIEDLESILDDCLAVSMPSKYLLWHYRSRHESLISFSNAEFYDNKLLTFPSPDNITSKVSLVKIDGFYDKGRTRRNKEEAKAIVDEITRRLNDETLRKKSLGVITFSIAQQMLIEDMLNETFLQNPELERIALEQEEPLFVKNLENVQGDERDVILFSIGYGPDAQGNISMNFGPVNRLGGERRLNVAVSRSRYEMIVYSTITADQIDLNRTSAKGSAILKRFLEYADSGVRSLSRERFEKSQETSLEKVIAFELEKLGYTVHTNIGYSGFRIDLGIVDPENEDKYILGILCDGENFIKTKTIRDREVVQTGVLKSLSWSVMRVWTMDWHNDKDEVISQIREQIKQAREKSCEEVSPPVKVIAPADFAIKEIQEETDNFRADYAFTNLGVAPYPPEFFYEAKSSQHILSQINSIMRTESPISLDLLCKKILASWGIARRGQRIDERFRNIFKKTDIYSCIHKDKIFLWLNKSQCENYEKYRLNSNRDATELPPEETANAIKQILQEQISMPREDLARAASLRLGFSKMGNNVKAAMDLGIDEALKRSLIKQENDKMSIIA